MDMTALQAAVRAVTAPGEPFETTVGRVNGVDYTIFVNAPEHLRALYAEGLAYADRDFLVYQRERYSFQESWDLAAKCANRLLAEGIRPGDRVGIALRNYPEWAFAYMGITSIGAIAVAMNAWWTAEEMVYGIRDSGLSVLFVDRERLERIGGHAERLGIELVTVRCRGEGWRTWEAFIAGASRTMPDVPLGGDDDAMILYTSGSTARPKGVLSIHRSITQALLGWEAASNIARRPWPELARQHAQPQHPPAIILSVPLFHVSGLVVQLLQSFRPGRKVVAMYKWDPEEALRIIETERITTFNGVPHHGVGTRPISRLRPVRLVESHERGRRRRTDGAGTVEAHQREDRSGLRRHRLGHDGDPGSRHRHRRTGLERTTDELRPGNASAGQGRGRRRNRQRGQAGRNRRTLHLGRDEFKCYWNRPEETAQTLVDGWVHTGDIGHMDQDDFVFITDRKKDMILRGGENIGCQEVEAVLYQHPDVAECAVFGVPDTRLGESVAAVVMLRPGAVLAVEALRRFAGEHLAQFKIPEHVWLREDRLPRTASEKIFKRSLRDEAIKELGTT